MKFVMEVDTHGDEKIMTNADLVRVLDAGLHELVGRALGVSGGFGFKVVGVFTEEGEE